MRLLAGILGSLSIVSFLCGAPSGLGGEPPQPPTGPFGYGLLENAGGGKADAEFFLSNETCSTCHERQFQEFQGSMHTAAHNDPLYRHLAELAREEAGEQVYTYCSSCHAPNGVASGLIPTLSDQDLPPDIKAGVTCDTCHQVTALKGTTGPWGEEANASFVIQQGLVRYGHSGLVAQNRLHTGEKREFFTKSEFCASCHTVIHPLTGFRIEHTYDEWKNSVYAKRGIQCQDCHMKSVEDAVKVAETLEPIVRQGQSATDGPIREIHPHFFVGANVDAEHLANGPQHARMAEARLKSAAKIEVRSPATYAPGKPLEFEVAVHNVAAGHHIPTGVTELRRMWIDVRITDEQGHTLYRSGALDEQGEFGPDTVWFGALAADASGNATYKPWEMRSFLKKRTVPPKGVEREKFLAPVSADAAGRLTIEARLLYRSAPPHIVSEIMKEHAYQPKVTEMAVARAIVDR